MTHVTQEGAILGTLHYMSPEQVQGKDADACSDIFSFGLVLYEMLAGRRAFPGENSASVMAAILTWQPPDLREPIAPAGLDRVLQRCLAKDPEDRWQSARDLKAALEWVAAGWNPGMPALRRLLPPPASGVSGLVNWIAAGYSSKGGYWIASAAWPLILVERSVSWYPPQAREPSTPAPADSPASTHNRWPEPAKPRINPVILAPLRPCFRHRRVSRFGDRNGPTSPGSASHPMASRWLSWRAGRFTSGRIDSLESRPMEGIASAGSPSGRRTAASWRSWPPVSSRSSTWRGNLPI